MNRELFFILAPIIFEGIIFIMLLIKSSGLIKDNRIAICVLFFISLIIHYAIEGVFISKVHKLTGDWIFKDNLKYLTSLEIYKHFQIITIAIMLFFIFMYGGAIFSELCLPEEAPAGGNILGVLFIAFVYFCIFYGFEDSINKTMANEILDNMEYTVDSEVFYLNTLSDNYFINGNIEGKGTGRFGRYDSYIQGSLLENYELRYAYKKENGEVVIDSLVYTKDNVHIFEDGDNCKPHILKKRFHKKYKDYQEEYYQYDVHIPSMSNVIEIDLN